MRSLAGLTAAGLCLVAAAAFAEPKAAPGYSVAVARTPGAVLAGLAASGEDLVVSNLADGRLYRRSGGNLVAFGPSLPHGKDVMGEPTGPYHLLPSDGGWVVTQGWTPADNDEGPYDHALLGIDKAGRVTVINRDFWNPFDLVRSGDDFFVVDAGRNSIERVGAKGERSTVFTFAKLAQPAGALKQLSPTEFAGDQANAVDAVPTGIAIRGDRLYVALFAGFPFVAGSGRVVSIGIADATAQVEAADLNSPVDLAFAEDGALLVLENGLYDGSGVWLGGARLLRIDPASGERRTLVDGLTRPFALLVKDGSHIVISQLDGALIFLRPVQP